MKNFALIGAAGYVAPRHMKAIKDTGNNLVAILDKFDAVGVIDSYFPNADFFQESERFDRHLDKLRRQGDNKIDYVSICSPNFLHDSHIRLALRNNADAICEKPLVLNPWNVDALAEIERETGRKINNILQVRLHPAIIKLKEAIEADKSGKLHDVDLTYIVSRGKWYFWSWKGDPSKSGGIATNIGIHFFDMLSFIFGKVKQNTLNYCDKNKCSGYLEFEKARARWFLSLDGNDLPENIKVKCQKSFRSILVDGNEVEFSDGFTDLHTLSFENILAGKGFGLDDARTSIEIVHSIRNSKPIGLKGDYHPFLNNIDK